MEGEEKIARGSERYICLRVSGIPGCKWYLMDLDELNKNMETEKKKKKNNIINNDDDDEEEEEEGYYSAVPPFLCIRHREYSAFSVSTGTDFYFLGGYVDRSVEDDDDYESWDTSSTKASRRAFKFDATNPDQGFVEAPPMLNERTQSLAKAFKGKIYVFGGCAMGKELFGECFNPELQEWTPIDCPRLGQDLRPGRGDMIAIPYDDNHLLVGPTPAADDNYYFLYNVEYNSWSVCPDSLIDIESCQSEPVKVGNTIYYRLEGCGNKDGDICAWDLESRTHYSGPIRRVIDSDFVVINSCEPALFHLGGDEFCYFTILKQVSYPHASSICYTKVRVVKPDCHNGCYLYTSIFSTLSIPVGKHVNRIIDTTPAH